MTFDKAIQVLSYEIDKMKSFREPFGVVSNDDFIVELRTAIQFLTKEPVLDQFVYAFTPENKSGYDGFYYNRNIPPQVALFKNGCFHEEQDHARQWADWWREVVLSQLC
jgi:hypothetical protein